MTSEIDADTRTDRYKVVCYRMGRSVPELETRWHRFDDALAEAVRRTTPQPSMRTDANRRTLAATGTMIFCIDPDYPDSEPYRQDADPHWYDAVLAADGAFPWDADLPRRKIDKLTRAGARRSA